MKPNERTVSFYDLRVESRFRAEEPLPSGVPTTKALEIAHAMHGGKPFSKGSATLQVTLTDWVFVPSAHEHRMIFNRADASLQDIPLRDIQTGATRMAGKSKTEGIDLTSHVLIRENPKPYGAALMLMTGGSSLPVAKVASILTRLFKNGEAHAAYAEHFQRENPNGAKNARLRLYSQFEVSGHQNAMLSHILQGGGLAGIDLISDANQMLDEDTSLLITSVEYSVVPVQHKVLSLKRLKAAISKAPGDIDKARVRYKPPGSSKLESHTFNLDDLDSAFVRKEVVKFNQPIQPRYQKVSAPIMEKLAELANKPV
jgi:hypothetical protein